VKSKFLAAGSWIFWDFERGGDPGLAHGTQTEIEGPADHRAPGAHRQRFQQTRPLRMPPYTLLFCRPPRRQTAAMPRTNYRALIYRWFSEKWFGGVAFTGISQYQNFATKLLR